TESRIVLEPHRLRAAARSYPLAALLPLISAKQLPVGRDRQLPTASVARAESPLSIGSSSIPSRGKSLISSLVIDHMRVIFSLLPSNRSADTLLVVEFTGHGPTDADTQGVFFSMQFGRLILLPALVLATAAPSFASTHA